MDNEDLYHVLVARPKDQKILVHKDRRLPVIQFPGCLDTHLPQLCQLVQEEFGYSFRVIRLRKECEQFVSAVRPNWCTLLLFDIPDKQDSTAPKNFIWILQTDAHKTRVEPPRAGVIEYLRKYKSQGLDINSDRLWPYSRAGWYDGACNWVNVILAKHGHDVQSITQLRSGGDSCMLRVISSSDLAFYMKAVIHGGWYEEVKVTSALGQIMPKKFPEPLSYDLDKNWLLMRDYGPTLGFEGFSAENNPELMRKVLSKWGEIQKKSIPLVQRLVRSGVPVFDGARLREEVLKVLQDPEWFQTQQEGMDEEERQRYNDECGYKGEYVAYVDRVLKKLSEYRVPLALVHGDLNPVNTIMDDEGGCVFIDLFCTRISFPFLDVLRFANDCSRGDVENLDFYLKFWTEYESIERLRELMLITNDIEDIEILVSTYLQYSMVEESQRLRQRREMWFAVIRTFNKYKEIES